MELNQAREAFIGLQAKLSAYGHAMALIHYDGATTAPKGTAANRGQTLGILSEESYRLSTSEETVALLEFLDANRSELPEKEARAVELAIKDIREMKKSLLRSTFPISSCWLRRTTYGTPPRRPTISSFSVPILRRSSTPSAVSQATALPKCILITIASTNMRTV